MPRKKKRGPSKYLLLSEEQVLLSKERTILAFMSTAVTFIGVGIVLVNVLKDVMFQLIGYGLILVGIIEVVESTRRLKEKQKTMKRLQRQTGI